MKPSPFQLPYTKPPKGISKNWYALSLELKKVKLGVYAKTQKGNVKILGECEFDLAQFANETKGASRLFKLQRCYDKNGHVEVEIKTTQIDQASNTSVDSNDGKIPEEVHSKPLIPSVPAASMWLKAEDAAKDYMRVVINKEPEEESGKPVVNMQSPTRFKYSSDKLLLDEGFNKSSSMMTRLSPNKTGSIYSRSPKKEERPSPLAKSCIEELKEKPMGELTKCIEQMEGEKVSLQKQMTRYERDLQEQIKQNLLDKEEFKRKIKELHERLEKVEATNSELSEKNSELEKSLAREVKASNEMSHEIPSLNQRLTQYLKQKTELDMQLSKATAELLNGNNKCEALSKEKADLEGNIAEIKSELSKVKTEKEAAIKALEALRTKLGNSLDNAGVTIELQTLQQDKDLSLVEYKTKSEILVNDLKAQLKDKESQIKQINDSLGQVKIQLQNYKIKSSSVETSLRNELTTLKQREEKQNREISNLNVQLLTLTNEYKTKELRLQALISDLGLQANSLRQENLVLQHTVEEYKKQVNELKEQLGKMATAAPPMYLDTEHDEIKGEEIDRLKMECAGKDAQIMELEAKLQFVPSVITKPYRSQHSPGGVRSFQSDKKALEAKVAKLEDKIKRLEAANEKEVGKLGAENDYLKEKVMIYEAKLKEYENTTNNNKRNESIAGDQRLKELLIKLKDENEFLKMENKKKGNENQMMEEKILEMKVKLANIEISQENNMSSSPSTEEDLKNMTKQKQALENELIKTKQELGEAMNREYEQEARNIDLIELLHKNGIKVPYSAKRSKK
eukprot:TRINITY_DN1126_c1_g1_i1.p1 TRINITY_DN1126_c1_g1~~TRINITY_DN1126_c1_g1_i1.p1  ORF type:complete len:796 (-),score=163.71 TRINITY_DN1126_c1_g1_i1:3495-5882(-)